MTQALTNVLLMDAVVGCLQTQRPIIAASRLAYFDKIKHEGLRSHRRAAFYASLLSFHTKLHILETCHHYSTIILPCSLQFCISVTSPPFESFSIHILSVIVLHY